jgi:hypothetical protein
MLSSSGIWVARHLLCSFIPWRWRWYFPPKRRFTYGLYLKIWQHLYSNFYDSRNWTLCCICYTRREYILRGPKVCKKVPKLSPFVLMKIITWKLKRLNGLNQWLETGTTEFVWNNAELYNLDNKFCGLYSRGRSAVDKYILGGLREGRAEATWEQGAISAFVWRLRRSKQECTIQSWTFRKHADL